MKGNIHMELRWLVDANGEKKLQYTSAAGLGQKVWHDVPVVTGK